MPRPDPDVSVPHEVDCQHIPTGGFFAECTHPDHAAAEALTLDKLVGFGEDPAGRRPVGQRRRLSSAESSTNVVPFRANAASLSPAMSSSCSRACSAAIAVSSSSSVIASAASPMACHAVSTRLR